MARHRNDSIKRGMKFFIFVLIILLILAFGFLIYRYFVAKEGNDYLIKNKYYSFELTTPKNWLAEKNMSFSEDGINQLLEQCKNDSSKDASDYQIGDFRFKDQNYPQNFGGPAGYSLAGLSSGAILDISIDCIPDGIKDKVIHYNYSSLKTGGEKTFEYFMDLPDFGKTKCLSFFHNNLRYKINEYVYISPADKGKNENDLRNNYAEIFNKIISSFKFHD
jgi:hypothetical protein